MSWVFLTDRHAFKLKKPVRYDSLDFSTLDLRRADCDRAVVLNRRLVAETLWDIYRDTQRDDPSPSLLRFYRSQHACTRAKIAAWHLQDAATEDTAKWRNKAARYLELAAEE
ncbi:MAG: hypothetical protein WD069_22635 [Planctomycetales bacterium]